MLASEFGLSHDLRSIVYSFKFATFGLVLKAMFVHITGMLGEFLPLSHLFIFYPLQAVGKLEPISADLGHEAGYTQERSTTNSRQNMQ